MAIEIEKEVRVAITGPLSILRKDAIRLIESKTNAKYAKRITHQISYLVASRLDTHKARSAAALGIAIISEREMMSFIQKGGFPEQVQLTIWSCSILVRKGGLLSDFRKDQE